nr:hypothetical protein [Tanacetum cinerariifolium]
RSSELRAHAEQDGAAVIVDLAELQLLVIVAVGIGVGDVDCFDAEGQLFGSANRQVAVERTKRCHICRHLSGAADP